MPVRINWLDEGRGVEFISAGKVTGAEIIAANKQIYQRANLLKLRYKIVDRTHCTEYLVTNEEVIIIADQARKAALVNPGIIMALVSTTPLQYGVSRVWQAYLDDSGLKTAIFEDRASAEEWVRGLLAPKECTPDQG